MTNPLRIEPELEGKTLQVAVPKIFLVLAVWQRQFHDGLAIKFCGSHQPLASLS